MSRKLDLNPAPFIREAHRFDHLSIPQTSGREDSSIMQQKQLHGQKKSYSYRPEKEETKRKKLVIFRLGPQTGC